MLPAERLAASLVVQLWATCCTRHDFKSPTECMIHLRHWNHNTFTIGPRGDYVQNWRLNGLWDLIGSAPCSERWSNGAREIIETENETHLSGMNEKTSLTWSNAKCHKSGKKHLVPPSTGTWVYRFRRHWMTDLPWLKHELAKHLDSRLPGGTPTHGHNSPEEGHFKDCNGQ